MNKNGALVVPASNNSSNAVEATLRDIKPPLEIPDYLFWLYVFLGIVAVAVIVFCLWKFWLKKKFEPAPVPPLPPHVRAKRKLRDALSQIKEPQVFTVLVSNIIRIYLEESFEFHAPERTTEEFLYELQSTNLLSADQKKSLGEFLSRCDLIKFAQYDPTQTELEDLHQAAMSLVEDTEPKPTPVALDSQPSTPDAKA